MPSAALAGIGPERQAVDFRGVGLESEQTRQRLDSLLKEGRMMEKRIQLKVVIFGAALAALVSAGAALAQAPCTQPEFCEGPCPITCTFSPGQPTAKFDFGTGHFIKITTTVEREFPLTIYFYFTDQDGLNARLNAALAPANCIPYDGATSNTALGSCGYYHVQEPLPIKGDPGCSDCDYSGDVMYKVFWDFPTLDQLNNVRLYRAPIPQEDTQTCPNGFECYTQDITDAVYPQGATGNGDPGTGGKSKGFSDYEVVDRPVDDLTTKVKIGLKKAKDAGILFDLKAVVKRNGNEVSSGELLGVPGGGKGFENAILRTIPLTVPTETFVGGDNISLKVLVRNSCLASPQPSGVARLWYDDSSQSQVNEIGATAALPTLYMVRGDDDEDENCDHERDRGDLSTSTGTKKKKRDVKVQAPVPTCDGPYRSFGKWSGTVPY
jgi:hypothetical protein